MPMVGEVIILLQAFLCQLLPEGIVADGDQIFVYLNRCQAF
jgi:hypothetical protein